MSAIDTWDSLLALPAELACVIVGEWLPLKDIGHLDSAYCHASKRKNLHESIFQSHLCCVANYNSDWETFRNPDWILARGIRGESADLSFPGNRTNWLKYMQQFGPWVKSLTFHDFENNDERVVCEILQLCVNLRMFVYSEGYVSENFLAALGCCTKLEFLLVTTYNKSVCGDADADREADLAAVSVVRLNVKSIALVGSPRAESAILKLCAPESVETLHLSLANDATDWSSFTHLRTVGFNRGLFEFGAPPDHTAKLVCVLCQCSWVSELDLSAMQFVPDEVMSQIICELKQIRCLDLQRIVDMTDESLYKLADRHRNTLEILHLFRCEEITGAGVNYILRHCTNLRTLSCNHTDEMDYSLLGNIATFVTDFPTEEDTVDTWGVLQDHCRNLQHLHLYLSEELFSEFQLHVNAAVNTVPHLPKLRCMHVVGYYGRKHQDALVDASRTLPEGVRLLSELDATWHNVLNLPFQIQ